MLRVRPDIFAYTDYRKFLADFFDYKKSRNLKFSFQQIAKELKTSRGYLKNIVDGRRHITSDKVSGIAKVFGLKPIETDYLLFMSLNAVIKDPYLEGRLSEFLGALKTQHFISCTNSVVDKKGYYSTESWLGSIIHKLSQLPDFEFSTSWIKDRLIDGEDFSEESIEAAMKELLEFGMIVKKNDRYEYGGPVHQHINPYAAKDSMKVFKTPVQKSVQVLEDAPKYRPVRYFTASFAINYQDFHKINQEFSKYHEKLVEISNAAVNSDHVVQVSSCFFNVTKVKDQKSSG